MTEMDCHFCVFWGNIRVRKRKNDTLQTALMVIYA